jgi:hypothetical protein
MFSMERLGSPLYITSSSATGEGSFSCSTRLSWIRVGVDLSAALAVAFAIAGRLEL